MLNRWKTLTRAVILLKTYETAESSGVAAARQRAAFWTGGPKGPPKRKDPLVAAPEWWRHLRPYNKRRVAKKERRAGNRIIQDTRENQANPAKN